MSKVVLGIDLGQDSLKLALMNGKSIKKTVAAVMPEMMLKQGRAVSVESMGEMLRDVMRENGIRAFHAAIVLPNEHVFLRNVTVPQMTAEQLKVNLPYEFRDYITDDLKNYIYDYAVIGQNDDNTMDLLAAAASSAYLEDLRLILKKAGLKMDMAAPAAGACAGLLRHLKAQPVETCIIDLGARSIRMYVFRGETHQVTRELEIGLEQIDSAVAESLNVDIHLAHTYVNTNYENCRELEACRQIYEKIAVELMRAVNFYRFSDPASQLQDAWICGGGVSNDSLVETIRQNLGLTIRPAKELLPECTPEEVSTFWQAVGITLYEK